MKPIKKVLPKDVKELVLIENKKAGLVQDLDTVINELTKVREKERTWWNKVVKKYKLDESKMHRIWIDGEIREERRFKQYARKIF